MTTTRSPRIEVGVNRATLEPFHSLADNLQAVMQASTGVEDPRLYSAGSGASTLSGPDGAYALRGPYVESLMGRITRKTVLGQRCDQKLLEGTTEGDFILTDEHIRTAGTGTAGVTVPYVRDGDQIPISIPSIRKVHIETQMAATAIPVTNKALQNSPMLAQGIEDTVVREVALTYDNGIWNGLGAGSMLGIRNSPALVTQALESTQTLANSGLFLATNASKMLAKVFNLADAAFYMHQENYAAIMLATIGGTTSGAVTPPDADAPFGRLWMRPMFPLEVAPAQGTVGDFVLASMSDYLLVHSGIEKVISPHVLFLTNESMFRFTVYFDGQPKCSGPITPFSGSTTQSPYVALAARS